MSALMPGPVYEPPWWLPGAHLQTIVPARLHQGAAVTFRRERWTTPDEDFIDLDWCEPLAVDAQVHVPTPLLVVFHGLEGSSASRYARGLMHAAQVRGWRGVVPNFRGCSGELNRAPRFYHSGDSAEADWILRRLRSQYPDAPLYATGISLGGNVLLKWLGEQREQAAHIVNSAAAISAPVDLAAGAVALRQGFNKVYTRDFLKSLKPKSLAKLEAYPGLFNRAALLAARDLTEFDDCVTAPLHGYQSADDYYRRASSKPLLPHLAVPTLMLNARNDPFLPAHCLPALHEVSPTVQLDYPEGGGHVGFWHKTAPGAEWMPERVLQFFQTQC